MRCTACSRPVRPVVSCDIDGTLGDYHGHLMAFAADYWDRPELLATEWRGKGNMAVPMELTLEQWREMKLAYRQGGQKRTMPVFPGALMMTEEIREAGAELWLATTRPYLRLDNVDPDTRWWLDRAGFRYDALLYGQDKYQQLAEAVDHGRVLAVIDDLPELLDEAHKLFPDAHLFQPTTIYNYEARSRYATRTNLGKITKTIVHTINNWNGA